MKNQTPFVIHSQGFILPLAILLLLGVSGIAVGDLYNNKMAHNSALNYKHRLETFAASDGIMTLLAQDLINGSGEKYLDTALTGDILGREYTGITDTGVGVLKSAMATLGAPFKNVKSSYLGGTIADTNYGVFWSGWIVPPLTGNYKFYVRSDKSSQFYLSTDASQQNLSTTPICYENKFLSQWSKIGTTGIQISNDIPLIAGNKYYFEFYHKQSGTRGVGQIGWDGPSGFYERPISGQYLMKDENASPQTKITVLGNYKVKYKVSATGMNQYRIFTEAFDVAKGNTLDTAFRAPLVQAISLQGAPLATSTKLKVPVIFYDYDTHVHDNPDFLKFTEFSPPQSNFQQGLILNMVKDTLTRFSTTDASYFGRTSIPKPNKNINAPNRTCGINYWFQDWSPTDTGYVYEWSKPATFCDWNWINTSDYNHKEKYKDTLTFDLDPNQGPGVFVFDRRSSVTTGNPADTVEFFPLDKYGIVDPPQNAWDNPKGHDYGFCMEMHTQFTFQTGLSFSFVGDDDVWAFINNKLVIDLGGIHEAVAGEVQLDDLSNLKSGQTYNFDFFQCERLPLRSESRIVTNIIKSQPIGNPVKSWTRDYGALE